MDVLQHFKRYLESQKKAPSKATVKNYLADVRKFLSWAQTTLKNDFHVKDITPETLALFKKELGNQDGAAARSQERYLSSLRKFFHFLKLEGYISTDPFAVAKEQQAQINTDPWHIKDFKNYLYVYNASDLTIKNYIIDVKQFLSWLEQVTKAEGHWEVKKHEEFALITSNLLEEYKSRLLYHAKLSPVSVNRKLSSLRRYINWAQSAGHIKPQTHLVIPSTLSNQVTDIASSHSNETIPNNTQTIDAQSMRAEVALAESDNQVPRYSSFGPIRFFQKLANAGFLLLDHSIVNPLAKGTEQAQYGIWAATGKKLFHVAPKGISFAFIDRFLSKGDVKLLNTLLHPTVGNVSKSMYAPLAVSIAHLPLHKKAWHHARHTRPAWYHKYHSYAFTHYLHLAILVIFMSAIGYGWYDAFVTTPQTKGRAFAALPTAPPRVLSFQGRLTDASDNPITTAATPLRFAIYNHLTSSGSALLWQEVQSVSPDADGVFSVLLGSNNAIPQSVFAENSSLYLGVTVQTDAELTPRQQIASVAYATNSETLQGLLPITGAGAGTTNVVLALDSSGNLSIGGSANPTFQASGGQFKLSGQPLLLTTNSGSNANITLSPDGTGKIDLHKPLQNTSTSNNITSAAGAVEVDDLFAILASSSGQSALTINQTSTGPLISASVSGIAKFTVDNNGAGTFADDLAVNGGDLTTTQSSFNLLNNTATTINFAGAATTLNIGANTGTTTIANAVTLGNATSDDITFTGHVASHILPKTDVTYDLGSASQRWNNIYANNIIAASSGTSGYWQRNANALAPTNITDDLLLGGTATSSAVWQVFSAGTNAGTATSSGQLTFRGTTDPKINILNGESFGIRTSVGGDAGLSERFTVLNSGNVGIGTTAPSGQLQVAGTYTTTTNNRVSLAGTMSSSNTTQQVGLSNSISFSPTGASLGAIYGAINLPTISGSSITISTIYGTYSRVDTAAGFTGGVTNMRTYGAGNPSLSGANPYATLVQYYSEGVSNGNATTSGTINNYGLQVGAHTAGADTGGTINNYGASINVPSGSGNGTTNNYGLYLTGSVTGAYSLYNNSTSTSFFNGNIGLGTTTPLAKIDIAGNASSSGVLTFRGTTDPKINVLNGEHFGIQTSVGGDAGLSQKFTILNNGNVGIGTTSPGAVTEIDTTDGTTALRILGGAGGVSESSYISVQDRARFGYDGSRGAVVIDDKNLTGATTTKHIVFDTAGSERMRITSTGSVGIGITSAITGLIHVNGAATGKALAVFNETGDQNIIAASASGVTQFTLSRTGDITLAGGDITGANSASIDIGEATSGDIEITGDLLPATDDTYDLGSTTKSWRNLYLTGNLCFDDTDCASTWSSLNYWQRNAGVLSPGNITDDLAIGGTASSSAKFQIFGTTGVASSSGTFTFRGTTDPKIDILNGEHFGIRTSVGGDAGLSEKFTILNNGNIGISTTAPGVKLHIKESGTNVAGLIVDTGGGGSGAGLSIRDNGNTSRSINIGHDGAGLYISGQNAGATGFRISGASSILELTTDSASNRIALSPGNTELVRLVGTTVGIGNTAPVAKLDLSGAITGKTLAIFNETGDQDIFTASASGTTRFTITNGGDVYINDGLSLFENAVSDGTVEATKFCTGDGETDCVTSFATITAGASIWQLNSGVIAPSAIANDLAIGGIATSSAKFQIFGTTGVASSSGTLSFTGTTDPKIDILNGENLIIRTSVGGDAGLNNRLTILNNGNIGIGTTAPVAKVHVANTYSTAVAAEQYGQLIGTTYSIADTGTKQGIRVNTSGTHTSGTMSSLISFMGLTTASGNGGTTTAASAFWGRVDANTGATVTSSYGVQLADGTGAGTIGTQYGLFVAELLKGSTNNYAIYTSGKTKSYFGGNVGIGTTAPAALLHVSGSTTGNAAVIINTTTSGADLLTASASGTTQFTLSYGGDITLAGGDITGANSASIDIGEATSGDVEITGDLLPSTDATYDLGSTTKSWKDLFITGQICFDDSNCASSWAGVGTNYWQLNAGALASAEITNDLLVGGNATSSAKFQIFGTTGVASSTATLSFAGSTDPKIDILNGEHFGIRTSVGGDAGLSEKVTILNNGNLGIGNTTPGSKLSVNTATTNDGIYLQGNSSAILSILTNMGSGAFNPISVANDRGIIFRGSAINDPGSGFVIAPWRNGAAGFRMDEGGAVTFTGGITGGKAELIVNQTGASTNDIFTASASGTTRFVIKNDGNVGIGTTTPSYPVHVVSSTVSSLLNLSGNQAKTNLYIENTATDGDPVLTFLLPGTRAWMMGIDDGDSDKFKIASTENSDFSGARLTIDTNGNMGVGTSNPVGKLNVDGATAGKALAIFNETGDQDILTASASGTTQFTLSRTGDITLVGGDITGANGAKIDIGEATSGDVEITGDLLPDTDATYDLGSTTKSWKDIFLTGQICFDDTDCLSTAAGLTNYWQKNLGVLSPASISDDLAIGGISTTAAKFQVFGLTGTASTSGTLSFRGTTDPKIDILNGEHFGIRTSAGGDAGLSEKITILNNGNLGIGTTAPSAKFEVTGDIKLSNGATRTITGPTGASEEFNINAGGTNVLDLNNGSGGSVRLFVDNGSGSALEFRIFDYASSSNDYLSVAHSGTYSYINTSNTADHLALQSGGGNVGLGTTAPAAKLEVNGGVYIDGSQSGYDGGELTLNGGAGTENAISTLATGAPIVSFDHRGNSNTGSWRWRNGTNAGSTRMTLDASGNLTMTRTYVSAGTAAAPTYAFSSDTDSGIFSGGDGTLGFAINTAEVGRFNSNGNLGIGTTDPSSFKLQVNGNVGPNTDATYDLGSTSLSWRHLYLTGNLCFDDTDCASSWGALSYWQRNSGALAPGNITDDLLIGGISTSSAKFQIFGTTGVASSTATLSFAGTTDPKIDILNGEHFGIRTSAGGDAGLAERFTVLNNGNVGIGTTSVGSKLDVNGVITGNTNGSSLKPASGNIAAIFGASGGTSGTANGLGAVSGFMFSNTTTEAALYGWVTGGTATGLIVNNSGTGDLARFQNTGTSLVVINNSGNLGIGTTAPLGKLNIDGAAVGKALAILNETGNQDILVGSASGTTKFRMTRTGDIHASQLVDIDNTDYYLDPASSGNSLIINGNIGVGTTSTSYKVDVTGSIRATTFMRGENVVVGGNDGIAGCMDNSDGLCGTGNLWLQSVGHVYVTAHSNGIGGSGNSGAIVLGTASGEGTKGFVQIDGTFGGNAALTVKQATGTGDIFAASSSAGVNRFLIQNNGNIGIGTTAPGSLVDMVSDGNAPNVRIIGYNDTPGAGPNFIIAHPRGSASSPTINSAEDELGTIRFQGYSSGFQTGAEIMALADAAWGASDTPGRLAFLTVPDGSSTSVERMRITNSGNIGIGTTLPSSLLDIAGTASLSANLTFRGSGTAHTFNILEGGSLSFQTSTTGQGDAGLATRMHLDNAGNLGIGTTTPLFALDVQDSRAASVAAQFYNTNTGTNADGLVVKLGNTSTTVVNANNDFISFQTVGIGIVGMIQGNGGKNVAYRTNGVADFAEYLPKNENEVIPYGAAVCEGTDGNVHPCDNTNRQLVGITSEFPTFVGGEDNGPRSIAVGLSGQLALSVSTKNGAIKPGDLLTISDIPGVAVKTTKAGPTVARALQAYNNGSTTGKIMVVIHMSWYDPDVYITSNGGLNIAEEISPIGEVKYAVKDADGNVISRIGRFSEAIIANITAGLVNAKKVTTNSLAIATDNVTVAGTSLRDYIIAVVSDANLTLTNSYVSPIASVDHLNTDLISPIASESAIAVSLDNSEFSILNSQFASGSAVATIDNTGNATFAGTVTSNEASIAGTLRAKKIIADEIVGLDAKLDSLAARSITASNAAIANITNTDQTTSSTNGQSGQQIGSPSASMLASLTSSSIKTDFADIASLSAILAYIPEFKSDFVTATQGLMSYGSTSLADTAIAGQLSINGSMILADNSINTLGSTLEIQPLRQGNVSFMAGLVNIDTDGNLTVNGNANFAKDVTVGGKLAANTIAPLPEKNLDVNLGKDLQINNASGSGVFAINQLGDLIASGAANISKLNFNLVAPAIATSDTESIATGSAGTATLKANKPEITINNTNVTEKSLIYITPVGDTDNQVLYLLRQAPGTSFTVGIGTTVNRDIQFNWMIVN